MSIERASRKHRGISLIELVMFIVIVGIAVTGVVMVMSRVTGHSADALVKKQAQAIAESMLEEIELQPFTKPAGGFAGPFTPENRANFDSVSDYNGFSMAGIREPGGAAVAGLGNYSLSVAVVPAPLGSVANAVRITVTVTDPADGTIVMDGYRAAYN